MITIAEANEHMGSIEMFFELYHNELTPSKTYDVRLATLRREQGKFQRNLEKEKELTIEITSNCDLRCIFCSSEAGPSCSSYMSPEEVQEALDEFPDFKKIRLSGGEPFKHPQLIDILELLKKSQRRVEILTCGIAYGKPLEIEVLKSSKPYISNLVFSLQGYGDLHDSIVQPDITEGQYWQSLMTSIKRTVSCRIPHSYHTVLLSTNFDSLEDIAINIGRFRDIIFLQSHYRRLYCPVNWHLLRFVKQGRGAHHPELALTTQQLEALPGLVEQFRNKFLNITYSNSFEAKQCDCSTRKAVVLHDGTRIGCSALKYSPKSGRFACQDRI